MSADGGKQPPPPLEEFVPEAFCDEGERAFDTTVSNAVCRRSCSRERFGCVFRDFPLVLCARERAVLYT